MDFALFYEAWASALEMQEKYSRVQEVYEMGINKRAEPLERLKRRRQEFEARMVERMKYQMQESSMPRPLLDPREEFGRRDALLDRQLGGAPTGSQCR